jgi:eukaryotic-like serine/threonine-protein kinase
MRDVLGHYRIGSKLGEGGMGVVYAAEDMRLGRTVALKTLRAGLTGADGRERLRREARTAASISHPNICQLYEIGEDAGELFIAMELLEGEPLASRLDRGSLLAHDAVRIVLEILAALSALHKRGIVHRDLKPSNVFLTEHGAKLLDFGIARAFVADAQRTMQSLTDAGTVVGTPRYMAPEQASGAPVDARSDLFAVGELLYEMLAGRPAFDGETAVRVLQAVMYKHPPVLAGSPLIAAVDRVIHRALAKQPSPRPATADVFSNELRAAGNASSLDNSPARPISRLIVLPFRLLRPDAEVDFLPFSLADAVTSSLAGLGSLVVRSSLTAATFGATADLQQIAREADVDLVLSGRLLRAGDRVRLTAELAEAPGGAILWSHVMEVACDDIFQLHDTLVQKLIDALSIPLTTREHRMLGRDVPATAKAYEFFLRANEVGKDPAGWDTAVDLYQRCLEQDPQYAPAWARLGYVFRMIAKYQDDGSTTNRARADDALSRALSINPDLWLAHKVIAQMEVEKGLALEALNRLLRQAGDTAADPEIYAALCHVCRYCGLLDASVAAHEQAIRLDSKVATSVVHTWFVRRDYQRVIDSGLRDPFVGALSLMERGRADEAIELLRIAEPKMPPRFRDFAMVARAIIDGRGPDVMKVLRQIVDQFGDPEGLYYASRSLARFGEIETAIKGLARAVEAGWFCYPALATDPWLGVLRGQDAFEAVMRRARERHEAAVVAFKDANGPRIVGIG